MNNPLIQDPRALDRMIDPEQLYMELLDQGHASGGDDPVGRCIQLLNEALAGMVSDADRKLFVETGERIDP
ncbi:hypothetical protein AABC73_29245 (plasmid) [Pseudomonas sp. G.S.17]|uniref:hypothetical protein n=1 Tax=Pseudomonas sp. G.S.17 TaxID=3137451 RepID=UPI00311CA699